MEEFAGLATVRFFLSNDAFVCDLSDAFSILAALKFSSFLSSLIMSSVHVQMTDFVASAANSSIN